MRNFFKDPSLHHEEKRTVKWFIALFYVVFLSFESFYFYFYPKYILNQSIEPIDESRYYYYLVIIILLPIMAWMFKKVHLFKLKYFFFISYTLSTIVYDSLTYYGTGLEYKSGNIVEVFLILFAPIFVNSVFYWTVAIGTTIKYAFIGLLLKTTVVLFPVSLVVILSLLGWIILKRFQSYLNAIKVSYDNQLSGIVKGVIATIELKDPYTRGHSERVAFYANSLAQATQKYTIEELRSFTRACLLHDIGKVNIPDSILMKPGKLSMEEYEIIKTHPEVGAEAIIKVNGLEESIDIIKSHHERWDGKGYPDQLTGEEIPYLARIVSIADAFDAMTSSRSYRAAMSIEEAYKRIIDGKGTQFDPELVELFKEVFHKWVSFHLNYDWNNTIPIQPNISLKGGEDMKIKKLKKVKTTCWWCAYLP